MLKLRVEIKEIWKTETLQNGFEKRFAVVQTLEQYPQTLKMEFTQNNVNLLDQVQTREIVYMTFSIKGNRVQKDGKDMFFQSLNVWKIER